jgi:ornithine cyclodeaminase
MLLKKNPTVIVAFGAGDQIFAHLRLLLSTYASVKECFIVNRSENDRLLQVQGALRKLHPDRVIQCVVADFTNARSIDVLQRTVSRADVICTATPSTSVLFDSAWVKTDTHINLVGSYTPDMQEVDSKLLSRANKVVVDCLEACSHEAGELIRAGLPRESLVEIGELVNADGSAISSLVNEAKAGGVTVFKSVGVGIQDVAIAKVVLERALEQGIGHTIHDFNES